MKGQHEKGQFRADALYQRVCTPPYIIWQHLNVSEPFFASYKYTGNPNAWGTRASAIRHVDQIRLPFTASNTHHLSSCRSFLALSDFFMSEALRARISGYSASTSFHFDASPISNKHTPVAAMMILRPGTGPYPRSQASNLPS